MVRFYLHSDNIRLYPFNITFTANSLPVFDSTMAELIINALYNTTYEFPNVTDAEGDFVRYYWVGIGSSLPFGSSHPDNTTTTLQFTDVEVADVGTYNIDYKACEDNDELYCTDYMNITLKVNRLPANTTTISNKAVIAHQTYTPISISCTTFTDADGDSVTVNMTISPSLSAVTLSYTSPCQINIGALTNSDANNYTVTLHAYDYASTASEHGTLSFNLEVAENTAPYNSTIVSDMTMPAHAVSPNNTKSMPANLFVDDDGDTLTYTLTTVPVSSLFVYDPVANTLTVSASDNNDVESYNVTIEVSDSVSETMNGTTSFLFNITTNLPPQINETLDTTTVQGNRTTKFALSAYAFNDLEGDSYTETFTVVPAVAYITFDPVSRNITVVSVDGDEGDYEVTITAIDEHSDTGETNSTFTLTISKNM